MKQQKILSCFFLFSFLLFGSFFVHASEVGWQTGLTPEQIDKILGGLEEISLEQEEIERAIELSRRMMEKEALKLTEKERKWIEQETKEREERKRDAAETEKKILQEVIRLSKLEQEKEYSKKFFIGRFSVLAKEGEVADRNLFQPKVLNQFSEGAGGAADCGYHAVKNAILVVKADFNQLRGEPLGKQLVDVKVMEDHLRRWRKLVYKYRLEKKLRDYLKNKFTDVLKGIPVLPSHSPFESYQLRDLYEGALNALASFVAKEIVQKEKEFSFDSDAARFLKELIKKRQMRQVEVDKYYKASEQRKTRGRLNSYVFDKEIMKQFIDFDKLKDFKVSFSMLRGLVWKLTLGEFETDWLHAFEIKSIWKVLNMSNSKFFVYGDVDLMGRSSVDGNMSDLRKAAQKIAAGQDLDVVFVLGTMKHFKKALKKKKVDGKEKKRSLKEELGGTMGHWFTLVRSHDGFYVVMDSADNINRLNDKSVKKTISFFENLVKRFKKR